MVMDSVVTVSADEYISTIFFAIVPVKSLKDMVLFRLPPLSA
jgi:hypothetical protein